MTSMFPNILSNEELQYFNNHSEVILAKSSLDTNPSGMVYFVLPITNLIRTTLQTRLGLDIPVDSKIPMRWIKGDIAPHKDVGTSVFKNTYLIYLNDSPGNFIIDSQSYPIEANTGFVFNEGISHETQNTNNVPRLLIGPMNEMAESVGVLIPAITYFATETHALNGISPLGSSGYEVGSGNTFGFTSWRIASNSTGSSPQNVVYPNGSLLQGGGAYNLYPSAPCFLEGSTILCQIDGIEKYIPVEQLKNGILVKTSLDGFKPVVLIGKGTIQNPGDNERTENRLYKCSTSKYPQLKEDLYITGCHSILEFILTEKQKEDTIKQVSKLFVTDKKYRLMAYIDERAEPWNSNGIYTIWHFALDHHDEKMNYGVYVNGGLLVETCCIQFLKKKSNMTFS